MPGLVAERIDPQFLAHALSGVTRGIVVVTGTNGKTTTTKMLAAILRAHGKRVFSNPTGSNFTRGVISAMLGDLPLTGRLDADIAVLELDEWHALQFAKVVTPTHALLLNVARDQLDRFAEIDTTAKLLGTLADQTSTGVVRNRDDSFVAAARRGALRRGRGALVRHRPRGRRRPARAARGRTPGSTTSSPRRSRPPTTACSSPATSGPRVPCSASARRPSARSSSSSAGSPR